MWDFLREVDGLQMLLALAGLFSVFLAIISGSDGRSILFLNLDQRMMLGAFGIMLILLGVIFQYPMLAMNTGLQNAIRGDGALGRNSLEKSFVVYVGNSLLSDSEMELARLRSQHPPDVVLEKMDEFLEDLSDQLKKKEYPALFTGLIKCWDKLDVGPRMDTMADFSLTSLQIPTKNLEDSQYYLLDEEEVEQAVESLKQSIDIAKTQWEELGLEANYCDGDIQEAGNAEPGTARDATDVSTTEAN